MAVAVVLTLILIIKDMKLIVIPSFSCNAKAETVVDCSQLYFVKFWL